MENSNWSGTCPHCGCPIEGVHYEGCGRNEVKKVNIMNKQKEREIAEYNFNIYATMTSGYNPFWVSHYYEILQQEHLEEYLQQRNKLTKIK